MSKDLLKSLAAESVAGKLYALALLLATLAHGAPWARLVVMGFASENRAACGSSHWGMASAIVMTVTFLLLVYSLLAELSGAMRRNLALAGAVLPITALILQLMFWLGTGPQSTSEDTPMGTFTMIAGKMPALWGFYLTFVLTHITMLAGLTRLRMAYR